MRVFLSWSGEYAREIAKAFADWIPSVLQSTEAFISTGGINAGERWLPKISRALDEIDFGFVFVTEQNKEAPWLLFEAGALAKHVETARVVPVLCGTSDDIEFKKNPLSHFQYVSLDRDGIFRAMNSLFEVSTDSKLSGHLFEKSLETWWPSLQAALADIKQPKAKVAAKQPQPDERMQKLEDAVSQLIGEVRRQGQAARNSAIYHLDTSFVSGGGSSGAGGGGAGTAGTFWTSAGGSGGSTVTGQTIFVPTATSDTKRRAEEANRRIEELEAALAAALAKPEKDPV